MNCAKCNTEVKPVLLFLGTTPGRACECEWSTLSRQEFKQAFGLSFSRAKRLADRQPKTYCFARGGAYSGNSHDRRKARRAEIRLLCQRQQVTRAELP